MNADLTPTFHNGEFEITFDADHAGSFRVYGPLLAKQLGHRDAEHLVRTLEDGEKTLVKRYPGSGTPNGLGVWYVTEPGFYKVVGQRNINLIRDEKVRAAVYRFQRWIFHEVIPQMMRAGRASGPQPGAVWSWDEVAAEIRQRYGLDYKPNEITAGLRAAGWLKSGSCTPKHEYRHRFWHTGSAYMVFPHVLPELVADFVATMRDIGDPQAQQYQLTIFSADDLRVIEGGAS